MKYVFTIFSNESHQFGFGGGVIVIVMGNEKYIRGLLYGVVQLCGLDKFIDVDLGGKFVVSELSF